MAYKNLKAEMGRDKVTIESISELLQIHRNSVANKLNGKTTFSIEEAKAIKTAFFPDYTLDYLFDTENQESMEQLEKV